MEEKVLQPGRRGLEGTGGPNPENANLNYKLG